jgi:hypothetical protein
MLAKHRGVAAAQPRQQPRRAFDVAEQERDGAGRKLRDNAQLGPIIAACQVVPRDGPPAPSPAPRHGRSLLISTKPQSRASGSTRVPRTRAELPKSAAATGTWTRRRLSRANSPGPDPSVRLRAAPKVTHSTTAAHRTRYPRLRYRPFRTPGVRRAAVALASSGALPDDRCRSRRSGALSVRDDLWQSWTRWSLVHEPYPRGGRPRLEDRVRFAAIMLSCSPGSRSRIFRGSWAARRRPRVAGSGNGPGGPHLGPACCRSQTGWSASTARRGQPCSPRPTATVDRTRVRARLLAARPWPRASTTSATRRASAAGGRCGPMPARPTERIASLSGRRSVTSYPSARDGAERDCGLKHSFDGPSRAYTAFC